MTTGELLAWLKTHKENLVKSLLEGSYQPQPVKGVSIPKVGGGTRQLGVPTVVDRLIQQAILQVLTSILDPTFSESSYGFRPKRSAHDALRRASAYVQDDRRYVVDLDLEKFFDRVNHDILMSRLARRVTDKRLLKLIRKYLQAGMMEDGVRVMRDEGTPQGGPLSPLLANLLLDDLDKELEKRGHKFCRYADDCNIYVGSIKAGERVMSSVTEFLERRLKLRVNREKSAVAPVEERKFLGYRLLFDGKLVIAPSSLKRAKGKIRKLTGRNRGRALKFTIAELNRFTTGWVTYFRYAKCQRHLEELDKWIRRRLRCYRIKQCKRKSALSVLLGTLGVSETRRRYVLGKGSWQRLAGSPVVQEGLSSKWLTEMGYKSLSARYLRLSKVETAVCDIACTVV